MGVRDPRALLYSCARGDSCHQGDGTGHQVLKGREGSQVCDLGKAAKSETLEVNLDKMTYKDKLKKGERDDASRQAVGASKAAPDKAKKLKKAEVGESPQAKLVAAKPAPKEA